MIKTESAPAATWTAAECPYTIEYSASVLDEIRLAVVEAFFSLPRGGAEIGGVLFGNWEGDRLSITAYAAFDCEHAFGPSFTLSPRDEQGLTDLLAAPPPDGTQVVGWYHSHRRSEIFLTSADQEIHRRFFPEERQVALVLKPHIYQPTRAGFFFREADGKIHAEASYNEFVLMPLAVKPAPSGEPPMPEPASIAEETVASSQSPALHPPSEPIIDRLPEPQPPLAAAEPAAPAQPAKPAAPAQPAKPAAMAQPATPTEPADDGPPRRSAEVTPTGPQRWRTAALALLAGAALGMAGYLWRDIWWPSAIVESRQRTASSTTLGLNTMDRDGQLQIRWNANSPLARNASGGILSIAGDLSMPRVVTLDKAHLLSGVFTFERLSERVDVSLTLTQPVGPAITETTTFMGRLPELKPAALPRNLNDPAVKEQRDLLVKQVGKMQADLNSEITRNAALKKTLDQLSKQLHDQQRSRLVNQVPDKK